MNHIDKYVMRETITLLTCEWSERRLAQLISVINRRRRVPPPTFISPLTRVQPSSRSPELSEWLCTEKEDDDEDRECALLGESFISLDCVLFKTESVDSTEACGPTVSSGARLTDSTDFAYFSADCFESIANRWKQNDNFTFLKIKKFKIYYQDLQEDALCADPKYE